MQCAVSDRGCVGLGEEGREELAPDGEGHLYILYCWTKALTRLAMVKPEGSVGGLEIQEKSHQNRSQNCFNI